MKRLIYIIPIIFILGCTHIIDKYRVTVDAITNPNITIQPTTYVIKPLAKETNIDELRFKRQSNILTNILNQKGYKQVSYENIAQQIIYFDYGIEKIKEETQIYSEPDVSFGFSWGYPYSYYPFWSDIGYNRYRTYRKTYKTFNRYVVILSKNQLGQELWRIDISSIGESNNLSQIVPLLLQASKDYIGKNTKKPIHIVIEKNSTKRE